MLPRSIVNEVERLLNAHVQSSRPASGGCINECAVISTTRGDFFLKWNRADAYPGMFEAELRGLHLLRETKTVKVPEPIVVGEARGFSWILMEAITAARRQRDYWQEFGRSLASLHRGTADRFGLDHDNYIGSLPQKNAWRATWLEFCVELRLEPQLRMAIDSGLLNGDDAKHFQRLYAQLDSIFPDEPPSLLHGDLWSGNFITGPDGEAWLIDPAVYYGHREMDIAMSRLFGGFDGGFYDAYNEAHPLANGWEERIEIAQLYPVLVHVNLFGGGYVGSVREIVRRF